MPDAADVQGFAVYLELRLFKNGAEEDWSSSASSSVAERIRVLLYVVRGTGQCVAFYNPRPRTFNWGPYAQDGATALGLLHSALIAASLGPTRDDRTAALSDRILAKMLKSRIEALVSLGGRLLVHTCQVCIDFGSTGPTLTQMLHAVQESLPDNVDVFFESPWREV